MSAAAGLLALPSLAAIDAELALRKRRPKSPADFAEAASRGRWRRARHLALLDRKLVALAEGRITRLIVTLPPRHGKSELCSRYFPAWFLGTRPDDPLIFCSYEADFAATWGGKARDLLTEFGPGLFGVTVSGETSARDHWRVQGREGGMVTSGVGGAITGRGARMLIIDDPVKNAQQATSQTYRDSVWQWWLTTALTRLEPGGSCLLIQTRWHEDDLAGRLIAQGDDDDDREDDERWEVLNLPAIAEGPDDPLGRKPGEALWPERWPMDKLRRRMRRLGSYVWNALYQQRPAPLEGGLFKRGWFDGRIIDREQVPRGLTWCRGWDLAATKQRAGSDPDYAAGCKVGTDGRRFYVAAMEHFREGPHETESRWRATTAADGPGVAVRIEQEPGSAAKLYVHSLAASMPAYDVRGVKAVGDKVTRAKPFSAACERGDVYLVKGNWDVDGFLSELCTFPNAAHDDRVDAPVIAFNELAGGVEPWEDEDVSSVLSYGDAMTA